MAVNWFLRLTDTYESWATQDADFTQIQADYTAGWTVIAAVTSDFSADYNVDVAVESGGGGWFLRLTSGYNTWGERGATTGGIETGSVDGGGIINIAVEVDFVASYNVFQPITNDFQAIWQIPQIISPLVGTIRAVGQSPTVVVKATVTADYSPVWTLVDSVSRDFSPFWQIDSTQGVNPSTGAIRFVGYAPTVYALTITPTVGTLVFAGQQPTLTRTYDYISPETGTIRFVGNIPSLDPKVVSPLVGTLTFTGQTPFVDLAHKFAYPFTATVRFMGLGIIEADYSPVWQVAATVITNDYSPFWNVGGSVTSDLPVIWSVQGGVDRISFRVKHRTFRPRTTTREVQFTSRTRQIRITQRAS